MKNIFFVDTKTERDGETWCLLRPLVARPKKLLSEVKDISVAFHSETKRKIGQKIFEFVIKLFTNDFTGTWVQTLQ